MYWASGTAKALELPPLTQKTYEQEELESSTDQTGSSSQPKILALIRNKSGNLFVTLTSTSLQLWGFRPIALISQVSRTKKSIEEYGENQNVFWKPDGSLVVVQTSRSCLFTYNVIPFDDKSYKYQFGNVSHHYTTGAGEGNGVKTYLLKFRMTIRIDAGMEVAIGTEDYLIVTTKSPPAIQCIPWQAEPGATKTNILARLDFLHYKKGITRIVYDRKISLFGWITSDGRAYAVQFNENPPLPPAGVKNPPIYWAGFSFHDEGSSKATFIAINAKFSLLAVGTESGIVYIYFAKNYNGRPVTSIAWTSDGYAVAVGWRDEGLALWSVYGRLLMTSMSDDGPQSLPNNFQDQFLCGIDNLFWGVGDYELFILHTKRKENECQIYSLPFVKSAVTGFHSPDNAKRGFLQMDDRLLLYRGGDQEDLSAINPDAIVWQHISIPNMYITDNWPIKYASISSDGRYIAISGRRGLAHYNVSSDRWKLFGNQQQEQEFAVRGGLLWFKHILVVACDNLRTHTNEIRMYSRETKLDNIYMIQNVQVPSNILYLSLLDNALLAYCGDNMIYHYLLTSASSETTGGAGGNSIGLKLCQQISFTGVIHAPARVRSISWFQPKSHKSFTPDNMQTASIIFLIDGKLVLLHPQKSDAGEVQYDLHVLADKIEFYWMANRGVGSLKNSLWACDGKGVKIWMNIWSQEEKAKDWQNDVLLSANKEGLHILLEFYPLSVLLDKGIIVGVEQQTSIRQSLEFAVFKLATNTHLFLQYIIRYMLTRELEDEAVAFATSYQKLVYFGHALEVLLHQVLEDEAENSIGKAKGAVLPRVIRFLNHFPHALDVIVGCARKTEVALWDYLFSIVGSPKDLFERCMTTGFLKTATSYLLVLHTLEPTAHSSEDTIRLLTRAMETEDYDLCTELVRFLNSIDGSGKTLKDASVSIRASAANNNNSNIDGTR
ncbi:710_t:CDS:10 [Ambispora leptoticha]|uniref:710_t:CDS:1 n=1 Tax=Ambispora leptoticha TaxID=144679 RepID=A0A9N9A0S4_9GLOM|nr:710_t:CDS:10 [Ambispora leptoticha]